MNNLKDVIIISKCGYDKAGFRILDPSEGYMQFWVKIIYKQHEYKGNKSDIWRILIF